MPTKTEVGEHFAPDCEIAMDSFSDVQTSRFGNTMDEMFNSHKCNKSMYRTRAELAWLAAAMLVFATCICMLIPSNAAAGTYDVYSCRGPAAESLPTSAWTSDAFGGSLSDVNFSDTCGSGGSLDVSLTPAIAYPTSTSGSYSAIAPAGTTIGAYSLWTYREVAAPAPPFTSIFSAGARERMTLSSFADLMCESIPSSCVSFGNEATPLSVGNMSTQSQSGLPRLELRASCSSDSCVAPPSTAATLKLYRSIIQLDDLTFPVIGSFSGSLVDNWSVDKEASLSIFASDTGGGMRRMSLSIDGNVNQQISTSSSGGRCRQPYFEMTPCPLDASQAFTVDTGQLANGTHSFSGTVEDAAGNQTAFGPTNFEVAHEANNAAANVAVPSNGTPAVLAPQISISSIGTTSLENGFASITGYLRTPEGAPIAGASIKIFARDIGIAGSQSSELLQVTTDASGRFVASIRVDGALRVELRFAPFALASDVTLYTTTFKSPLAISIKRSSAKIRNKRNLVLSGAIRGAGAASKNLPLLIQTRLKSGWRTVGSIETNASGKYKWSYTFKRVVSPTKFKFRIAIVKSPSWPWPAAQSRSVSVRVKP